MNGPRRWLLPVVVLLGMVLPFLGKPVHIDDANFLMLAKGAVADPWRPHAVMVNWQGHMERAFDVLSNPPGIGWWLAPVESAPVWAQHLFMLPWLFLAMWGAWTLGRRFTDRADVAILLILGAPGAVLAAHSLTPDLPLLALVLAGFAGLTRTAQAQGQARPRRWPWALLLGCAALFRYSGAVLIPVVAVWPLLRDGRAGLREAVLLGLAAAVPLDLLILHDALAYGQIHLLTMASFQSVSDTPRDLFRKVVATIAMLGGGLVLPVLCWARPQAALLGLVAGCMLGGFAASISDQSGAAALATLTAASAGGAVLFAVLPTKRPDPDTALLLVWAGLGLGFMLVLRFTATRYLLPFFTPIVLLGLRAIGSGRLGRRLVQIALPLTLGLSALLAIDDLHLAQAQRRLAWRVDALAHNAGELRLFAGHWGWQHYLQARGWTPLEDDAPIPAGALFASSRISWPQEPEKSCLVTVQRLVEPGPAWLPRVHSWSGAANFHASMISARPPIESYAPWTFSVDPYDVVELDRACDPGGD
ncbi:MAG: hypothetical protein GXP62_15480 [Oligoflexia bacterium]|nr:hypothetical protein [Oligoflexia bacterium]